MALLSRGVGSTLPSYSSGLPSLSTTSSSSYSSSSHESTREVMQSELFFHGVVVDTTVVHRMGQFGAIYVAKWHKTKVAAKRVYEIFAGSNRDLLLNFIRELKILSKIKHPNILQFFGLCNVSNPREFELSSDTFVIQELMCCALDVRNRQQPRLNLRNVVDLCIGVSSALCYLHERADPIIHHNLSARNIFLDFTGQPKICNLAVTRTLLLGPHTSRVYQQQQQQQQQSELYLPPEMRHTRKKTYSSKLDIYSFGVVMLELCIGRDGTVGVVFQTGPTGHPRSLIPEVERREVDFKELGNKHPLYPLIVSCLSEVEARPSARLIGEQLATISQSDVYLSTPQIPVVSALLDVDSMEEGGVSKSFALSAAKLKELTTKKELLEEDNSALRADNDLLKRKLDAYIRYEREEMENSVQGACKMSEQEIEKLMSENAKLQTALLQKDAELEEMAAFNSPPSSLTNTQLRDQRASLMQKVNELQTSKKQEIERSRFEIQALRNENKKLQLEVQVLQAAKSSKSSEYHPQGSSHCLPPGVGGGGGPMSLPEQLPSYSSSTTTSSAYSSSGTSNISESTSSTSSNPLPSLSTLEITSSSSVSSSSMSSSSGSTSLRTTAPDSAVPSMTEFKKMKKQLERYKSVNIELDQRLKDAKLELQSFEGRQGNTDIMYRMDIDRLRAENSRLQAQLNSANSQLHRMRV